MLATLYIALASASLLLVEGATIAPRLLTCPDLSNCGGYYAKEVDYSVGVNCVYVRFVPGPMKGTGLFQCNWGTDGKLVQSFNGGRTGISDAVCPATINTACPTAPSTGEGGARQIHPNGNQYKCLDVSGDKRENGTPVQVYDCNGTPAQNWVWNEADTKIRLADSNFCLDAGTNPASGVGMKIWTCYDNLPAQAWYRTADLRFAVTGKGQCLDVPNGNVANLNRVQTWACGTGNLNQVWT